MKNLNFKSIDVSLNQNTDRSILARTFTNTLLGIS